MIEEFEADVAARRLYIGKRLNELGEEAYRAALPDALALGSPEGLQAKLEPVPGDLWIPGIIAKNGRRSTTSVTAAQTLAEGEFNRFYMRAICVRATSEGDGTVKVRRGKQVANPRSDPSVKVNENDVLEAALALEDIRRHPGDDTALGMPRGPNSGLSLEFNPHSG